jgi:adenosylmethionine-8-amino-7-oxononanoate aminotransferase
MNNQQLKEEDLKYIWHPCSQMQDYEENLPLIPIKKGKGIYLEDFEGNLYLDSISSWWVNIFGHVNEYINTKIIDQLSSLEHTIFAGFTHKPAIDLAKRIVNITPQGLDKVFFADNGSSGIEVALKMSFHYFKNLGEDRPYFVSLTNSYHGETMGALAVGDVELYKDTYNEIIIQTLQTPAPKDQSKKSADEALLKARELFEQKGHQISSIIIEPLVQCAGYMKMYHHSFISGLRRLCDEFNIHLIADEVAVGFGRTGTMFAIEQSDVSPDFMILSKGLTGGYMALALVLTTDKVYNAFYCDYNEYKAFLHSHSYTGNAIACACANATLDIFQNDNIIENNKTNIEYITTVIQKFKKLDNVLEVRQTGFIVAIELKGYNSKQRINLKIYKEALKKGLFIRPLGNVVYFMPPYIITKEQIDFSFNTIFDILLTLDE